VRRYLADTHVVVWTLAEQVGRLGKSARRVVRAWESGTAELAVSVVSLWEVALLSDAGRLRLARGFAAWCDALEAAPGLRVEPLLRGDVEQARSLRHLRDPHDQLIAGTALRLGIPLLSADSRIAASAVRVVWD
jgi:PIN domain nuclease of toxin-antitoxin system